MTIALVFFTTSHGVPRFVAIADKRISQTSSQGTAPLSDLSEKLFSLDVRSFERAGLKMSRVVGELLDPVATSRIGIAYSGHCTESLCLLAIARKHLSNLICLEKEAGLPTSDDLRRYLQKLFETYFGKHSKAVNCAVSWLVFGFDGDAPWMFKVSWDGAACTAKAHGAMEGIVAAIGQSRALENEIRPLLKSILRQLNKVSKEYDDAKIDEALVWEDVFDTQLTVEKRRALFPVTLRKALEAAVERGSSSVGGAVQSLQLGLDGDRLSAAQSMLGDDATCGMWVGLKWQTLDMKG